MSPRRQMLVAGVGAVFATVLFFVFVLKPKLAEISDARSDIEAAQQQEQTLNRELKRLQALQRNEPETRAKLAKVSAFLPSSPDLPGFIRQVQSAATKSSADLQSIAPSPPSDLADAKGVQTINATLTVHAGFRRLEDFLARLEHLDRVVEVRNLSLSPVVDELSGETVLDSTITLVMYVVADNAVVTTTARRTTAPSRATASPSASASASARSTP